MAQQQITNQGGSEIASNKTIMRTLGGNVTLESAYGRLMSVRDRMNKLVIFVNSQKSPSVSIQQLKQVVADTTTPSLFMIRDLAYFFEILNQKQIQKDQRKKYTMKMKMKMRATKTTS